MLTKTLALKEQGGFLFKRGKGLNNLSIFLLKKLFRYNEPKYLFFKYYAIFYCLKIIILALIIYG